MFPCPQAEQERGVKGTPQDVKWPQRELRTTYIIPGLLAWEENPEKAMNGLASPHGLSQCEVQTRDEVGRADLGQRTEGVHSMRHTGI